METFLTVTNLLLLLFWVRLWSQPERELYFNPFLSAPTRLTDRVLDFLRPVLPLPGRLTSLIVLAFLLGFRAIALNHFRAETPWAITIGGIFSFVPDEVGVRSAVLFSVMDFLFFVARFWGVYVMTQFLTPVRRRDRASEAFHFAALPLAGLRRWLQVLLLLTIHSILVYELALVGTLDPHLPLVIHGHPFAPPAVASAHGAAYLACLTLFSVADLLTMAWQLMFTLLVGSFVAMVLQNALLNAVCSEGVATLLGRSGKRLIVGFLDLSPLLYMASVYILCYLVILPGLFFVIAKLQSQ